MKRFFLTLSAGLLATALGLTATEYVMARPGTRFANLPYVAATAPDFDAQRHRLDVYAPNERLPAGRPVVLFIHGGSWNSGSKDVFIYKAIGRRLARQGIVGVVISYRLSPQVHVPEQAADCARALAWTVQHIKEYGGDPARVYVMGHSAGGGLAGLLAADDSLLARHGLPRNPVRGAIMDDPAGLDMYTYLKRREYGDEDEYLIPFTHDPAVWRENSALYHLHAGSPPFVFFIGGKTYPSISSSAARVRDRLRALGQPPHYQVLPGKHHIPMVLQLYWTDNVIYQEIRKMVFGATSGGQ